MFFLRRKKHKYIQPKSIRYPVKFNRTTFESRYQTGVKQENEKKKVRIEHTSSVINGKKKEKRNLIFLKLLKFVFVSLFKFIDFSLFHLTSLYSIFSHLPPAYTICFPFIYFLPV